MLIPTLITLNEPSVSVSEILRYSAGGGDATGVGALLDECISEALPNLVYRAVYCRVPVIRRGACIDFDAFSVKSHTLDLALSGSEEAIVFVSSIGLFPDRAIRRYSAVSPARALLHQAIGAERVESLCDALTVCLSEELGVSFRPRVSPGYGDIPLTIQPDIVSLLDAPKLIGVTLNDSLLMSPTKSVSAIMGIKK